jgi:LmbE family N-acetylglucosaminyl deacetylase
MDAYRQFVRRFEDALGMALPAPAVRATKLPPPAPDAPVALLFSPHPDDEVITGALPLRLQREAGARIVNVAVTLGSNPARRDGRRRELENACALLGWDLEILGWEGVLPEAAQNNATWPGWVGAAAQIIQRLKPRWVIYPHANDWHPTHRGTHLLAEAALAQAGTTSTPLWRVQTEYWHPLENPNLLVECAPDLLAKLVAALCCHAGEIARNPYHLTLPAWMMDNVRRGAERVTGPGKSAPGFKFGTLYRVEPTLPPGWNPILSAATTLPA